MSQKSLFWLVFVVMLAVYLTMVLWSLPTVAAQAGGLPPFDMRPTGYTFEEARAFLAALTPEGTAFYRTVQHRLDMIYPALLGATLILALWFLSATLPTWLRMLLAVTAIPVTIFDWLENAAVDTMLQVGANGLTVDMAAGASRWTVLKSASTAIVMTVVLVLLAAWGYARLRAGSRRHM